MFCSDGSAAGSGSGGGEMSRKRKLEPDANGEGASGGDTNEPIAESWSKTEQYKVKVSSNPYLITFLF